MDKNIKINPHVNILMRTNPEYFFDGNIINPSNVNKTIKMNLKSGHYEDIIHGWDYPDELIINIWDKNLTKKEVKAINRKIREWYREEEIDHQLGHGKNL